jgi:hypothetical protein
MNERDMTQLESRLRTAAVTLPYPPTPDIAASVRARLAPASNASQRWPKSWLARFARSASQDFGFRRRRLAWVAVALALALFILLAVPQTRAAIIEFFQIGVVRIFPVAPTPTPTPTGTPTITPAPTPTFLPSVLNLAGETTLAEAQTAVPFAIRLPEYPSDLGPPDHVFLQNLDGAFLVLVWLDPDQPASVRLSLHMIERGSFAISKVQPTVIKTTTVKDQPAMWAEGPYVVQLRGGNMDFQRLIDGHVLIWEEAGLTYRLETDLPMEEAVRITESLEPIPFNCPVTPTVIDTPPDDPNADPFGSGPWFINADKTIWAGPGPEHWAAGESGNKVIWIRPTGTQLEVSGQRLDADAPELEVWIPDGYLTGFQVTGMTFPTPGCWEVTATAGESELKFVVEIPD